MAENILINRLNDVGNTQNEYLSRFHVNRNIRKLLQNDIALYNRYSKLTQNIIIQDYTDTQTYQIGDLVWFRDSIQRIWLLRKTLNYTGYSDKPQDAVNKNVKKPNFKEHGWKDENEYIDILDYEIDKNISRLVKARLNEHQKSSEYHRYGKLETEQDAYRKLMLKDISNVDSERDRTFFPYKTMRLKETDSIMNGYVRIWDKGLIEFDIVYRFGYCGKDEDGYDVLTCNDMKFSTTQNISNGKYFNATDDTSIFYLNNTSEKNYSKIDDTIQKNRNDFVNTYFAKIRFPKMTFPIDGRQKVIRVENSNYMIFGSNVMSQDRDMGSNCINSSPNQITYCDRTASGFTAILITYPSDGHYNEEGYNATNGGLVSNSFHCTVVGKWKVEE